jgi:site-specific recombinase XerD
MLKKRATTLSQESIDRFRSWLFGRGKSSHTVKAYTTDLRMFLKELSSDPTEQAIPMENDLGEELEELGSAWLTKHRRILAPKTTGRRLTSLRAFAEWAGYPDLFKDYDAPDAGPTMPHPLPEGMSGVRRLIEVASNQKQRSLIALCGMCGLRVAEALDVRFPDFTIQGQRVTLTVRGKGDVVRHVPVSSEAYDTVVRSMVEQMASGLPIVGLEDRYARRCITDLGVRAGLSRRIASHDLRATFATAVYNKTKDQRLVQLLLGHKSGSTTEGYIGVEVEQMQNGVEGL